jgi:hypothetical protein
MNHQRRHHGLSKPAQISHTMVVVTIVAHQSSEPSTNTPNEYPAYKVAGEVLKTKKLLVIIGASGEINTHFIRQLICDFAETSSNTIIYIDLQDPVPVPIRQRDPRPTRQFDPRLRRRPRLHAACPVSPGGEEPARRRNRPGDPPQMAQGPCGVCQATPQPRPT